MCLSLLVATSPAMAQGAAALAVPKSGTNAEAVYRAKVRESITATLQNWARSLEKKDSVGTVSTYTSNARSVMGDEPEAVTAPAIVTQLYKTPFAGSYVDVSVKDFDMSGDLAFVSSVLIAPAAAGDGAPTMVRSLFVFRYDAWRDRWQVREQFIDWRAPLDSAVGAASASVR